MAIHSGDYIDKNNVLGSLVGMNTINPADWQDAVLNSSYAIWSREDSAYQRMVEDMKKAGLNPWIGISSGGSQTSQVNPVVDSLNSTLSILMNNREFADTFMKGVDTTGKAVDRLMSFYKGLTDIGGQLAKMGSSL